MRSLWLVLLAVGLSLNAEERTNFFPVLEIRGHFYTNALFTRVTPGDAIMEFDGGGIRVKLADLPQGLQKQFGYDPEKAQQYLAARQHRRAVPGAAQPAPGQASAATNQNQPPALAAASAATNQPPLLAAVSAATNQPPAQAVASAAPGAREERRLIRIIDIVATNIYSRCLASIDGTKKEILLDRLPPKLQESFDRLYSIQTLVNESAKSLEADKKSAAAQMAGAPDVATRDPSRLQQQVEQRRQAQLAAVKARDEEQELADMKSYLKALREENQKIANILATPTGKTFAGTPIWKCAE